MITLDQTAALAEAERLRSGGADVAVWVLPSGVTIVVTLGK